MARAQCCCGELAIEVLGSPKRFGVCHCYNCRRRTGSAFGASAYFDLAQVKEILGASSVYGFESKHSKGSQRRYFCANCGTTLYWIYSETPEELGVAGGCFEIGYLNAPDYSVSNDNKLQWLTIRILHKSWADSGLGP
ncbi:GFA family protein [Microbulbifer taiwanensis]|uniref:GFA family protein n=1 Tax=Microbulbifer taiwanensis TaxID=986746 RepID=A0ABW1YRM3_9GAMM